MVTTIEFLQTLSTAEIGMLRAPLNPFALTAKEFLGFAVEDSEIATIRGKVNTLGNVKRTIDCRIEELLYCYCLYKKSSHHKWHIPTKLQILEQIGILAPRILRKINTLRNRLEHQFEKPSFEEIEDAIDVAQLFIGATENLCFAIMELYVGTVCKPDCIIVIKRDKDEIELQKDSQKQILKIGIQDDWIAIAEILEKKRKAWGP